MGGLRIHVEIREAPPGGGSGGGVVVHTLGELDSLWREKCKTRPWVLDVVQDKG